MIPKKLKKIGLIGGAFNPIHNGHVAMGISLLKTGLVDAVEFMPCYSHRHGKDMAAPHHRMNMVAEVTTSLWRTYGSEFYSNHVEMRLRHDGSTYDLLTKHLLPAYNEQYYYVVGSDNAKNIHKWHRWQDLIRSFPFIVIQREGELPISSNEWYMEAPHKFLKLNIEELSSTRVRNLIKEYGYRAFRDHALVPNVVENYIIKNRLYL